MVVESALLFGTPPSEDPLRLSLGRPSKAGLRKMTVPLTVDIPLDRLTFLPVSEGVQQARLELRIAVIDKGGNQAEIPIIPIVIEGGTSASPEGKFYSYEVSLKMRRERHRAVVSVYDQASGSMLSGTAEVSP